jgi:hypothetical protein
VRLTPSRRPDTHGVVFAFWYWREWLLIKTINGAARLSRGFERLAQWLSDK